MFDSLFPKQKPAQKATTPVMKTQPMQKKKIEQPKQVARQSFICGGCSYKFSRDSASRLVDKCPYCSSKSVYQYKPLTADYFLKTVKTEEDEFKDEQKAKASGAKPTDAKSVAPWRR